MWTDLRQNIESIRKENKIPETDFKPLDIHSWRGIEQKIISTFCTIPDHKTKFYWLWEDFKLDTHSIWFNKNWPFEELLSIVDHSEKVWLFINETINEGPKFWFYEGFINPIVFVLKESFVDEIYIASTKYEWLLCMNHHDVLIATGLYMPGKLRQIENDLKE